MRHRGAADDEGAVVERLCLGDLGLVRALRQIAENPVDQRRRLGFVDIADNADEEAAAVEPRAREGGEIIAGDRPDTFLAAIDAAAVRVLLKSVMHPETPR